jgi:hypothetical protein
VIPQSTRADSFKRMLGRTLRESDGTVSGTQHEIEDFVRHLTRMRQEEIVPSSGDDDLPRSNDLTLKACALQCVLCCDSGVHRPTLLSRAVIEGIP